MSEEREFIFLWEIENINFCTHIHNESIDSPLFKSVNLFGTSWYLNLYPRGTGANDVGYVSCYLKRTAEVPPFDFEYEIQIMSSEETIVKSEKVPKSSQIKYSWGFPNFWKKSLNDVKGVLKIRCQIKCNAKKIPLRWASIGKTKIYVDEYSFILALSLRKNNSNCYDVKKFSSNDENEYKSYQFQILLTFHEDDVMILIRKLKGRYTQAVMCRITLMDLEGGKHDSREAQHIFYENNPTWEFPTFLKKSKLEAKKVYWRFDDFFLKCKLNISNRSQINSFKTKDFFSPSGAGTKSISEDYRSLYKDKIHTDVKLIVDGEIIHAHKSILSARSPVFLAMFGTDMVENKIGSVSIPDLEAETVNALLEYMYVGSVDKLDCEMATKLIVAADKYQVLSFKEECADLLKWFLSDDNVCNVLVVADSIQHEVLKSAAMIYIKDNSERIFLSKEWKSVVEKYVPLAAETVQKVSMLIAADRKKTEDE